MREEDTEIGREYLIELLQQGEVKVEFTKKDGTKRKMQCTLQPELLPKREITEDDESKPKKEPNLDIIQVYDLEKKAWRSFRVESVTAFSFSI